MPKTFCKMVTSYPKKTGEKSPVIQYDDGKKGLKAKYTKMIMN